MDFYAGISHEAPNVGGFITIQANGTYDPTNHARFWNGKACCDHNEMNSNDKAYLVGLVDEAKANFNVDPEQVYAFGHSNGGLMAQILVCQENDTFKGQVCQENDTFKGLVCQENDTFKGLVCQENDTFKGLVCQENDTFKGLVCQENDTFKGLVCQENDTFKGLVCQENDTFKGLVCQENDTFKGMAGLSPNVIPGKCWETKATRVLLVSGTEDGGFVSRAVCECG